MLVCSYLELSAVVLQLLLTGEVFVEGDFEGEELAAVCGLDAAQFEMCALERVGQVLKIIEEEAGAGGVRLDGDGAVLELREVLLDLLIQILALAADFYRADGNFAARIGRAVEGALSIARLGSGNFIAGGGDEVDARVVEGDGSVAFVGDDNADGDDIGRNVVDAEGGGLLLCVIGIDCDGEVVGGVALECGVLIGGLRGRRGMLGGKRNGHDKHGQECGSERQRQQGTHAQN